MPQSASPEIRIIPFEDRLLGQVAAAYQMAWGMADAYAEDFTDQEARRIILGLPDFWLAMVGDELAGFVGGTPVSDYDDYTRKVCKNEAVSYYINELVVLPQQRCRGLGYRLLQFLMDAASRRGFTDFLLRTSLHEPNPAVALYRNLGFETLTDDRGLPVVRITSQARTDKRADQDARVYLTCTRPDPLAGPALSPELEEFAIEVRKGLLKPRGKTLPNRFIYDERGSRIFEKIGELPEYYVTRCETAIIEERSSEIAKFCSGRVAVVELGSGSGAKTKTILSAVLDTNLRVAYFPVDISVAALRATEATLRAEYPNLPIHPLSGDYEAGLAQFDHEPYDTVIVLWLGTSIGNMEPPQAEGLLRRIKEAGGQRVFVLLGVDLKKDKAVLERAYDDAQGVTAQFNLNLLDRINRDLGGHFDLKDFEHRALYDEVAGRIEMHIVSKCKQSVSIDKIGASVDFEKYEFIHTENSYKFSVEEIAKLCWRSGFSLIHHWRDVDSLFSLNLLEAN
jgi:dimethylhistidine N-methyltransferase